MVETQAVDLDRVADDLQLRREQVENVMALLDAGNTVPFITRYRKEQTGNLDEEQIRSIQQRVSFLRQLAERAETILRLIDAQGKLTPEFESEIRSATTLKRLEDLYLPFRPKRTSRAEQARQRGLQPLADAIWNEDPSISELDAAAAPLVNTEQDLPDTAAVLQGVSDIIAERISENVEVRDRCRKTAWKTGRLTVSAGKSNGEQAQQYRDYFDYEEDVAKIPPHRILALNRGEKDGALRIKFTWDDGRVQAQVAMLLGLMRHRWGRFLQQIAADALSRLIQPSLEREVRRELTDQAELHAVTVFARNLRNLLLQPPVKDERIAAIDPGFRTGCKLAALDDCGQCLETGVIYVTGSEEKRQTAKQILIDFCHRNAVSRIAIGNGTACRETEELVAEAIADGLPNVKYLIVNEAGASIYSTSPVAREEFPELDATARGTISIGRRLQDPLSELVKIEPQHIGVGMYQHDIGAKRLRESLDQVIESCVNYVGVDLNTASASLLRHVSGFNQLIAHRVVAWRSEHGRFSSRRQLLDVNGIGEATFTQAAGFLKISNGDEPLDSTWIHPESYEATRKLLARFDLSPNVVTSAKADRSELQERFRACDRSALGQELQLGLPTLSDVIEALLRPGRDPRGDLPGPMFKQHVLSFDDLHPGMELTGTVLNVVDFGAFIDVGLKDSGLVHISQMSSEWVANPHEVVAVGDFVTVWVLDLDTERRRVSLSMISPERQIRPAAAK